MLFVNSTKLFDATYQRYLLNVFRERLPFRDIPIKLYMRSRRQADEGSRSPTENWEDSRGQSSSARRRQKAISMQPTLIAGPISTWHSRFLNREVNELLSDLDG